VIASRGRTGGGDKDGQRVDEKGKKSSWEEEQWIVAQEKEEKW
jgi:hypothetical protein